MKSSTGASESGTTVPPKKRVGPITFINQVRAEGRKVTWTSTRETWIASVMVMIMVLAAAIFFYLSDSLIKVVVGLLTGIWGGGAATNG